MTDDHPRRECDDAIAALDAVLAEQSDRVDEPLTKATTCVARLRDGLIRQRRAAERPTGDLDERLRRVNAVLSLVVGSHYTLVGLRWKRLGQARDALKNLFGST